MKDRRPKILTVAALLFAAGSAYIVYAGRPAAKMAASNAANSSEAGAGGTFTMADIQAHSSASDCWSAINGGVYDLTDWISRHPGGPYRIIPLCGTDGSDAFNGQHGRQRRPAAALALLKIGTLVK